MVYEEPAREPYSDEEWYLEAFGEPYENIVEEFTWQRVPKRLNRALSREEVARFGGVLEDLLSELPGSAPELSGSKIFGSDEEEIEQGIANVMAMFGVEADSITGRRLNAYLRDTSNTLALESVLQLLDVPTELALVPTTGFDVASISTARIFGNEDEGFTQHADAAEPAEADSADEAQTSEALDVTFPLDDSVAEATFSENPVPENTFAEDASFEDDEEIEPYPGNFPSPMERSYRLVATGRRVTLAEWMDAISEGHIPFEYTHMSFPEDAFDEEEDILDSEAFDDFEAHYEQDRDSDMDEANQPTGGRNFTPEEEEAILAHLRAALAPHSAQPATEQSAVEQSASSQAEATPVEDAPSDTAGSDDAPAENASAEDAPSQATQVTQVAPSARATSKKPTSKKRLTAEQIRAKTRRVGLVLGADVTAQSAIALTLAKVARRRRAQGKASRKFSVAAALFALNAAVGSALIPTVLRSFEQSQMKKHARPVADAELVHPGGSASDERSTKKRTLIDDLREGHYRTVEDVAPSTEQAPSGLRERALGIVRSIRQRAAKKTDR